MKKKSLLLRLVVLVTAMMCAFGAAAVEAYACYTSSNTTLTFYYDNQRSSRTGTTYDLNTGISNPGWYSDGTSPNVTKVVFNSSFVNTRPTNTFHWFYAMTNLQSITGMSYLNTSEVTNMGFMFYNCYNLPSVDVSSFNTSKVTNMQSMFSGCSQLTNLDVSGFNTSNVTNMQDMFDYCLRLTSLDLCSFNTSNVTDMRYMFYKCTNLQTIYVGSGWSTAAVTSSTNMFYGCTSLVGGQGTTYNANHIDATYAHIDGGTSNPGYFTEKGPEAYACYTPSNTTLTFYYDSQRSSRTGTTYDLNTGGNDTGWDTDVTNASVTKVVFDPSFADARPTTTCDWFYRMENLESITGMSYLNTSEVTNMNWMFMRCAKLTNLDVSYFNTSKVTSVTRMFYGCSNLRTIYVGNGWSTAAVATSNNMFSNCTSLVGGQGTTYDENHVDKAYAHIDGGTSNPGYFTRDPNSPEPYACYTPSNTTLTFYYDNQRSSRTGTTYDLNTGSNDAGWDTDGTKSNVTKVVFDPSFTGARPTTTYDWFYYMQNLESITGLNYLNTSEVTNMDWMFLGCGKLTSLDFSSFNTSRVTSMYHMFDGCVKLQTIYVGSGWSTAAVTSSSEMFNFCPRLVGGQGTTWDIDNPKDKTYAHIDGGTSNPGYFTEWKEAYACYTPSNTTLTFYYDNLRSSRTGTTYDLNTGNYSPGWYTDGTYSNVSEVKFDPSFTNALPTTCHSWFRDMAQLQTIYGLNYLNTSAVTHMVSMFRGCSSLTVLDLSSFSTANVIAMGGMFMGCSNLRTIYAGSGWSTAAVEASAGMFSSCTSLVGGQGTTFNSSHVGIDYAHIDGGPSNPGYFTEKGPEAYACYTPSNTTLTFYYDNQRSSRTGTTYDLNTGTNITGWESDGTNASVTKVVFDPSFASARPTTTWSWFYGMRNLQSITGMSYLNTSEVTNMNFMFLGCSELTSLDVSHFNTSKVTSMIQMFSITSLTNLDLSSFNTSKVTNMQSMFEGSTNLRTIYVGNGWSTAAVTSSTNMFYNCTRLVGGQGTTYDANHIDKAYAHIDGGPSNPGYFTAKNAALRGDVNGDGQVKISDVTALINYLLSSNATGINLQAADCNQDGNVKIGDVTALINYLLSGTW